MSSKREILAAIRRHSLDDAPLPSLERDWITYADRRQRFREVLESVGGRCLDAPHSGAIEDALSQLPEFAAAKKICAAVPGVSRANVDLDAIDDPHALEDVDFAVLPGQFAVAENAAVWVTGAGLKHRAIYFIPQHLALVLPAGEIVDNMHQAYERLELVGRGFGTFISGPSKTADIEQSLVIGAHGPRSLAVLLATD